MHLIAALHPQRLAERVASLAARFRRDARGVSAVEFALILPVMITLLLATAETTQGLRADRKVSIVSRALSDLASQASTIANQDMTNILDAGAQVLAPFGFDRARARITGIQINEQGVATVGWSDHRNWTRFNCGAPIAVPASLMPPRGERGFLVLAEVEYSYMPTIPYLMPSSVTLKDRLYTRPRIGETVSRTPSQGAQCV